MTEPQTLSVEPEKFVPSSLHRSIPEKITVPAGYNVFIIPDDKMAELVPPPQVAMPISGYMDHEGQVHYELCNTAWTMPRGWRRRLKILLQMRDYYSKIPDQICAHSLTKDPDRLIGAGTAIYYPEEKLCHLAFLGLRPSSEIPDIDPTMRKEAIFRFQQSYNRMVQWIGATRTTTYTGIIPDGKMRALGWKPYQIASWGEKWRVFKECTPSSLLAKIRTYEVKFE